jgi:hypothetical protein
MAARMVMELGTVLPGASGAKYCFQMLSSHEKISENIKNIQIK